MPEGNRLAGYAIVAILLLAIFVAYSLGRIDSPQRAEAEARNQHACSEGDYARCETKPIILEPSGEQRPADPYEKPNRDEYRSESDLAAQWAMAKWARLASIASFIGIVLLFVTWHATAQGVRETRKIGEKQVQAYLIANSGELRVIRKFSTKTMRFSYGIACNIAVANKGQSPGRVIDITYEMWAIKEIDESGKAQGYLNWEGSTFCADVGPGAQETAIISSDLLVDSQFSEFEQSYSWIDIRGEMVWKNEFGNEQRQAINLATPKFWYHDVFTRDGSFNEKGRLPLVGIGRRTYKLTQ